MKKKSFLVGAGALLLMASMNLGHAVSGYGFLSGNLCGRILAQTTTTGSGNTSTGGGSTGGSSSTGTGGSSTGGASGGFLKNRIELPVKGDSFKFDEPIYSSSNPNTIIGKVTIERTPYTVDCPEGSGNCAFDKKWNVDKIVSSQTF